MTRVVPAVVRALKILNLFLENRETLTVSDVITRLDLPRTTAHELVHSLVACRYLRKLTDQPHRFSLGLRLFELGSAYAARLDLIQKGHEVMRGIVTACNETVQMAMLDNTEVVYLAKVDSTRSVRVVSDVGRRLPAHCTGLGKMLLSGLPDDEIRARYAAPGTLMAMTPNSITSLKRLLLELSQVRARGLAFDNCESNVDVRCVAAPIYAQGNVMVAAMSVSVPIIRMDSGRRAQLATLVRDGARQLSLELGYGVRSYAAGGMSPHTEAQGRAVRTDTGAVGQPRSRKSRSNEGMGAQLPSAGSRPQDERSGSSRKHNRQTK